MLGGLALELGLEDDVVERVGPFLGDACYGTESARCEHDVVLVQERVLPDVGVDVASGNVVADLCQKRLNDSRHSRTVKRITLYVVGVKSHLMDRSSASVLMPRGM